MHVVSHVSASSFKFVAFTLHYITLQEFVKE